MITDSTLIGQQLGPYLIEDVVGRGGMGVVYRARHTALDRLVALKVLVPELAQNPSFRERFVRESQIAASIDHPNVIPIYDATEIDGTYFIAMRFVDGMDLKEVLQHESLHMLDIRRALTFVSQIAGALDAAHEHGLVHRDVKPGNILVAAGSEHCYLTDFGLTKAASSDTGFTATGHFVGTTDYCAPEQIEGKPVDRRTDVYSLGCVLYECLTGRLPFVRENAMAVMYAHMHDPPPAISAVRRDLPPALDQVIANSMAKDINHRYPTCSALAADTRAALEVGTGRALPAVPMVSGAFTQPEAEMPSFATPPTAHLQGNGAPPYDPAQWAHTSAGMQGPVPPPSRGRGMTLVAVVIAALLLAAGGTAAALIVSKRDKDSTPSADTNEPAGQPPAENPPEEPRNEGPVKEPGPDEGEETPTPPVDPAAEEAAAQAAVEEHWTLINSHEFGAAFDVFTAPYATSVSRSGWIQDHIDAEIENASVDVQSASVSGDSGTVTVNSVQSVDKDGLHCFAGSYGMTKVDGEWRISDPALKRNSC